MRPGSERNVRWAGRFRSINSHWLAGPTRRSRPTRHPRFVLRLDPAALDRKLAAAADYPELAAEVENAKQRFGTAQFAIEILEKADGPSTYPEGSGKVFYEMHAEKQVAAGLYTDVIRYAEHIAPIREALAAWAANPRG